MANISGVQTVNQRPFYSIQRVEVPRQALGSGTTTMDTVNSHVYGITVSNTTSGTMTMTIQGHETGGDIASLPATPIAPYSVTVINTPYGDFFQNGWEVVASGTGFNFYASWDRQAS